MIWHILIGIWFGFGIAAAWITAMIFYHFKIARDVNYVRGMAALIIGGPLALWVIKGWIVEIITTALKEEV